MKEIILFSLFTLCFFISSNAQTKVANFSIGKFGAENYEHFSFWVKDGKRTDINYTYGVNRKDIKIKYVGTNVHKGDSCFRVQFPNNYIIYIIPTGLSLKVTDDKGKYLKNFSWEYEGPINGIGTFCEICVGDEDAAILMIKLNYLR